MRQVIQFVTLNCDSELCGKSVTYAATEEGQMEAFQDNPWMRTIRTVATSDANPGTREPRMFTYCSDECEANGLATGKHNPLEQKRIQTATNATQVALAAVAAHQAAEASKALKAGTGVTVSRG